MRLANPFSLGAISIVSLDLRTWERAILGQLVLNPVSTAVFSGVDVGMLAAAASGMFSIDPVERGISIKLRCFFHFIYVAHTIKLFLRGLH
jgi:hypothetical protein